MSKRARPTQFFTAALVGVALAAGAASCGGSGNNTPDFAAADLAALNFTPDELPGMEYQAKSSGTGTFSRDTDHPQFQRRLEDLGLEGDYVSQFFGATRKSELGFAESIALLFDDAPSAEKAAAAFEAEYLIYLDAAKRIDGPGVGKDGFGVVGKFGGYPAYTFGWRVGDVVQLITAAPNDGAGPRDTLALARRLEAKAEQDRRER